MDLDGIRNILKLGSDVEYTAHCQKRMLERGISRSDIRDCILCGEIIEEYPLDNTNESAKSVPSCLILGNRLRDNAAIHVVVGYNEFKVLIISACYPDSIHWLDDNKTRRR